MLYMNGGKWEGNQIIQANWVSASHQSYINRNKPDQGYGYQFWTWDDKVGPRAIHLVAAVGNGDQRIFFDHANQLMVVTTAGNYNQWTIKNNTRALLMNFIYPAFLH
ncbi:MAG: hypothetical protein C5B59_06085 [Bacteroidetes bacterium]|nr:MAG: hypothetical protein C5B59_06085 [Bacteroidota bacterium]